MILKFLAMISSVVLVAAWLTHIAACIRAGAVIHATFGGVFFPYGITRGVFIWAGVL